MGFNLKQTIRKNFDEWLPVGFLVGLLLLVGFMSISNAKTYDVYYNGATAYVVQAQTDKLYATVELINELELGADGKYHFNDCGSVMCLAKIRINATENTLFNKNNLITGIIKYNSTYATFNQLYAQDASGSFNNIDLSKQALLLKADASIVFGLEFYREDNADQMDLIPVLFENELNEWAWWDAYQPASNATGNVVNITACGTYAQSNKVFQMTANLTAALNSSCLTLSGSNNTFNGMWNSITYNQVNFATLTRGIFTSGSNLTIENLTITGFFYPLGGSGTNHTIRFVNITGVTLGATSTEECFGVGNNNYRANLTSINCGGTPYYGIFSWSGYNNVSLTLTNVNVYGAVASGGVGLSSTASTWIDGGSNYWATCGGNCTWYSITTTNTSVLASEDAPTYSLHPTTNYGTADRAGLVSPSGNLSSDIFFKWTYPSSPPGKNISSVRFTNMLAGQPTGTQLYQTPYTVAGTFNESNITWNTKPANIVATGATCAVIGAGQVISICQLDWNSTGLISQQATYGQYGDFIFKAYFLTGTSLSGESFLRTYSNSAWRPYLNFTWRPAIYDAPATASISTGGYNYTIKQALATNGSTYCSFSAPTTSTANLIYNSITLAETTTKYTTTKNATHNWITFPCSQNTFYTMEMDTPLFYLANATTCAPSYDTISSYYFIDEITEQNRTANATIYLYGSDGTSLIQRINSTQSFKVCMYGSAVATANITVVYENYTSSIRTHYQQINETTSNTILLPLLSTSQGAYYTFQTITSANIPVQDANLLFYHYSVPQGQWILLENVSTDFSGYATVLLQSFTPHQILITATGYNIINTSYTPTTVTLIQIRLYALNASLPVIPSYERIWNSTYYALSPSPGYHASPVNISFTVTDLNTSSAIDYYGWNITRTYNGTATSINQTNITVDSNGGSLYQLNITDRGQYVVRYYFKRIGYDEFHGTLTVYTGNNTGVSLGAGYLPTIISPWAYVFFAVIVSMIAAGFVSRYTLDGAAIVGLLVMAGFVLMWSTAPIAVGGADIPFWIIWMMTSIIVFVALAYRWVF